MTRQEIMQQIAALDKQINEIAGKDRVARGSLSGRAFPAGNWIGALAIGAIWFFGGQIAPLAELHRAYAFYVFIAAALLAVLAIIRTVQWVLQPGLGANKGLAESLERVRGLQLQRQELQRRLAEIDKKV